MGPDCFVRDTIRRRQQTTTRTRGVLQKKTLDQEFMRFSGSLTAEKAAESEEFVLFIFMCGAVRAKPECDRRVGPVLDELYRCFF